MKTSLVKICNQLYLGTILINLLIQLSEFQKPYQQFKIRPNIPDTDHDQEEAIYVEPIPHTDKNIRVNGNNIPKSNQQPILFFNPENHDFSNKESLLKYKPDYSIDFEANPNFKKNTDMYKFIDMGADYEVLNSPKIDISRRHTDGRLSREPLKHSSNVKYIEYPNITMWQMLSSMSTVQFLQNFNIKPMGKIYPNPHGRSYDVNGKNNIMKNYTSNDIKIPKHQLQTAIADHAYCSPRITCIEIENEDPLRWQFRKHGMMYWPTCIEIERCSGCCLHGCLKCVPTETSLKQFIIYQLEIILTDNGFEFNHTRTLNVKLDKHEKCACNCDRKIPECRETQCI